MKLIKPALGQTGNKLKLLPQLLQHFPEHKTFCDPFTGSGVVAVNMDAEKLLINDNCKPIIGWLKVLYEKPIQQILYHLDKEIKYFDLSASNKEGFLALRDAYNLLPNDYWFYLLNSHAFSNGIRFNSSSHFNYPFGARTFNPTRRRNMIDFVSEWQKKTIEFHSGDFEDINYEGFSYFDPPYTNGVATYNSGWNTISDLRLFDLLDEMNNNGLKWAMSNALTNNFKINHELSHWSEQYKVIEIDSSYRGSNYQRNNNGRTSEILVVNY